MTTTVRISDLGELLACVPFQLGFRPERSVVVLTFRGTRLGLVMRVDLPDDRDAGLLADRLVSVAVRERVEAVLVVGYEQHEGESTVAVRALTARARAAAIEVMPPAVVRGDGYVCSCTTCTDEPHPLPYAADVPAVAELVGAGRAALDSRDELVAAYREAGTVRDGSALTARYARRVKPLEVAGAWNRFAQGVTPDRREAALMVGGLRDRELRDTVIAWLCPGHLPPDRLSLTHRRVLESLHSGPEPRFGTEWDDWHHGVLTRLQRLAHRTPSSQTAPLLCVLASMHWWLGDGALAAVAVERALELEPDLRLAQLLDQAIMHGVRWAGRERPAGPPDPGQEGSAA